MILVNGVPFPHNSSEEENTLAALLKHDLLISSSDTFKAIAERELSIPEDPETPSPANCKWVYLFQREYATVHRSLVDFVGTDEATTCVGLAIWNPKTGMTSVSHMDSPDIVDGGLDQMLSKFVDCTSDDVLDVHIIGAFEDDSPNCSSDSSDSESERDTGGLSVPLCFKIIETLKTRKEKFHLKTLCILSHNTRRDSKGIGFPLITGFVVETLTGSVIPARFDSTSRCPDDIVRRIRVTSSYEDTAWNGKLLETYDTENDRFRIAPCQWTPRQIELAEFLIMLPDSDILKICSTSPDAESPDFVENERQKWDYLIRNPDWRLTFPMKQPRIFERTDKGIWKRSCEAQSEDRLAHVSEL